MASVNKVIILGNLGRDVEVRYMSNGAATCTISVATTRSWKNKDSGEKVEETEWHRVVFFDRLAEVAGEYLKKGHPVYVEGRLKTRKWADKDGVEKYTTEIVAEHMQLLGGRDSGGQRDEGAPPPQRGQSQQRGGGRGGNDGYGAPPQQRGGGNQQRGGGGSHNANTGRGSTGFDDMDDDIPFVRQAIGAEAMSTKSRRITRTRF